MKVAGIILYISILTIIFYAIAGQWFEVGNSIRFLFSLFIAAFVVINAYGMIDTFIPDPKKPEDPAA